MNSRACKAGASASEFEFRSIAIEFDAMRCPMSKARMLELGLDLGNVDN